MRLATNEVRRIVVLSSATVAVALLVLSCLLPGTSAGLFLAYMVSVVVFVFASSVPAEAYPDFS